MEQVDIL